MLLARRFHLFYVSSIRIASSSFVIQQQHQHRQHGTILSSSLLLTTSHRNCWRRKRSMSTSCTRSVGVMTDIRQEEEEPLNDVALVWKVHEGHAQIGLESIMASSSTTSTTPAQGAVAPPPPPPPPGTISSEDFEHKKELENDTLVESSETIIPESVLQYERQLRKAAHGKKLDLIYSDDLLVEVYADASIVVVHKPPGVLTVPGIHSRDSIATLVHAKYCCDSSIDNGGGDNDNDGQENPTTTATTTTKLEHTIVHRLDMDTSGLVLFGRNLNVTKRLHEMFRAQNEVEKEYQALVMGHWPTIAAGAGVGIDSATIHLPLQRDHEHPPFMRISTPRSEAAAAAALKDLQQHGWKKLVSKAPKPSHTELFVMERGYLDNNNNNNYGLPFTRVRLIPKTGRTHQLRVHLAACGFPIIGDPTYSIYGEANLQGGLQQGNVAMRTMRRIAREDDDAENNTKDETDEEASAFTIIEPCPLQVQKAWTAAHPPNVKPMCLHASRLAFQHPATGEPLVFELPPSF